MIKIWVSTPRRGGGCPRLCPFDPAWLKPRGPILVRFDGLCLLCSRSIRFVAREDHADLIRFQPFAGNEAPDSMLVETGSMTLDRSDAVLAILHALGGRWRALALCGTIIPRFLRDFLYDFIASHRYEWFGKSDTCDLPDEEVKRRMM
jgi:predicted DCC family thiol-disulfide oxidoreductase YuxK